jgi:hemolysin activation/secretion protein
MINVQCAQDVCKATIGINLIRLAPLLAQVPLENMRQLPLLPQQLQEDSLLLLSPQLTSEQSELNSEKQKIKIKSFVFKGNTVFSTKQLQAVVAPYIGREITRAELLEARAAITKLYIERGYITSGGFLSLEQNQAVKRAAAVVTIQIVEGRADVNISGAPRLHSYIQAKLTKATLPLNRDHLVEALQQLQANPLIEKISAQLREGQQPYTTVLDVEVKERQTLKAEITMNNSRSPAVGTFERGISLSKANLLGWRDRLSLGYRNTDGSNIVEVGYSVPVNLENGTVNFDYLNVSSHIVEKPFNKLDIRSNTRVYEFSFRQPLLEQVSSDTSKEFAIGLTASRQESESSLLNIPFPLSIGADVKGRTRISALQFFQEWTQTNEHSVLLARSQLSLGIGAFDSTSQFFMWRGQVAWLRPLIGKTSILLRTDLQLADGSISALEQFGLGGAATVRGYRQDNFLTDNGFLFSTEVRIPIWQEKAGELQLIPFADLGTTWNNSNKKLRDTSILQSGTLLSLGLGLQLSIGSRLMARLDWGVPLLSSKNNSNSTTWQENGIYLNLRYQPW